MTSTRRSAVRALGILAILCSATAIAGAAPGCLALGDRHDRTEVQKAECVTCHLGDYDRTASPPHAGIFPETCADCHTTLAWRPAQAIRHDWWPLRNRHLEQACAACHASGYTSRSTPRACEDCHRGDYDAAIAPPHVGYPTDCAQCHDDAGWRPSTFMHPWPLQGAHLRISCFDCHWGDPPTYAGTPRDCAGCHEADYNRTTRPPHAASALPTDCTTCHTTEAWVPSTFAHPWTLDGAHAGAACVSCHTGTPPRYAGTPTRCVDCHDPSPDPGHTTSTACADCHTTSAWIPALGGGHPEPVFPITAGAHVGIACLDCHDASLGPSTGGTNTDCVGCHEGRHAMSIVDAQHADVGGYRFDASNPHFCLDCHPRGQR